LKPEDFRLRNFPALFQSKNENLGVQENFSRKEFSAQKIAIVSNFLASGIKFLKL
jgi:hypothetical protein